MSADQKTQRRKLPDCPRCGARMQDIVSIAPILGEPGLIGYECPKCGCVTSKIIRAMQAKSKV